MATITEVAKLAGVSVTTVSRVINGSSHVSDNKRSQVKLAMQELGYTPLQAARQLRGSGTQTIAVTVPFITNPFFSELVAAIERTADEHAYKIVIVQTFGRKDHELNALEFLKTNQVDAVILCAIQNDWAVIKEYKQYGLIAVCNEYPADFSVPTVRADQEDGVYEGTRYLLQQGYRKVAFCTGLKEFILRPSGTDLNSDRYRGFSRALKEFDLSTNLDWLYTDATTIDDGRAILQQIQAAENPPDAIVAGSDQVAAGIIAEARRLHVRIPKDLGVLGFDDQAICTVVSQPITTIRQPIKEMGARITEIVVNHLAREAEREEQVTYPLAVVARESA
ncbi:LacI family DNA-binding transcriptional regulator [Schleiferilactobacillus harbinensis]|uniref:LacI family DNA-binding transcriptional regulator n=1 Tax=Schleiferilactobacillus harbinensis TaxID=304207 RepID=UPI00345E67E0